MFRMGTSFVQRIVVLSAALTCPTSRAFFPRGSSLLRRQSLPMPEYDTKWISRRNTTARFLSSSGAPADIKHVGIPVMQEIIEDYQMGGREESQYCVIDVRTEEEVASTGKLGENVYTLPVQVIMQANVFEMDPEEFSKFCGFEKPTMDETIVFTCAAGIRSVYACNFAAQAGYSKIVNYAGGANEWFQHFN